MKWMISGGAVLAILHSAPLAEAEPAKADIWIGVDGTADGFLIDGQTGSVWMTGVCLKPIGTALNHGETWQARLVEMVSVGRGRTRLDQTFVLNTDAATPSITVSNPDRGGDQTIDDVVMVECAAVGAPCKRALDGPAC